MDQWVGPEGWLSPHPLGGTLCRDHAHFPVFAFDIQKLQLNFGHFAFYCSYSPPPPPATKGPHAVIFSLLEFPCVLLRQQMFVQVHVL